MNEAKNKHDRDARNDTGLTYSEWLNGFSKYSNEYQRNAIHRYKSALHEQRKVRCRDVAQGAILFDCGRSEGKFCLYDTCPIIRR